jgi:hypothetical protein
VRLADVNGVLWRGEIFSNPSLAVVDLVHGDDAQNDPKVAPLRAKRMREFHRLAGGDVWDLACLLVECVTGVKGTLYGQGKMVKLDEDTRFGVIEAGSSCRRVLGQHAAEFLLTCLSLSPPRIEKFVQTLTDFKTNLAAISGPKVEGAANIAITQPSSVSAITKVPSQQSNTSVASSDSPRLPNIALATESQISAQPISISSTGSATAKNPKNKFQLRLNLDDDVSNDGNVNNGNVSTDSLNNAKAPLKKKRFGLSLDIEPDGHTSDEIVQVIVKRDDGIDSFGKDKSTLIESMLQRAGDKVSKSRQITPAHYAEGGDQVGACTSFAHSTLASQPSSVRSLGSSAGGKRTAAQRKFLTAHATSNATPRTAKPFDREFSCASLISTTGECGAYLRPYIHSFIHSFI